MTQVPTVESRDDQQELVMADLCKRLLIYGKEDAHGIRG